MKYIWKFPLENTDEQVIRMPDDAAVVAVQVQYGRPCIWALIDPDAEPALRKIHIYGTGHAMPNAPGGYVGTYQLDDGFLVFHVFDAGWVL